MKLCSFEIDGRSSFGEVADGQVLDVGEVLAGQYPDLASTLSEGAGVFDRARDRARAFDIDRVRFLPVIPNPAKIFCIGINYSSHLAETGRPAPAKPVVFTRCAESQVGAGDAIVRPPESIELDFEGELAVIIGRGGRRISASDALSRVAGYSCYNDATLRDWQRHTSQFAPGKNFWRTGGFGPWMVTADEIPDPSALHVTTRLNGTVMQQAGTADLVFGVAELVEYCSTFVTLRPGDVIVTGTTGGVGAFRQPPVWMKHGDLVEVEISGIGLLRNAVVDEDRLMAEAAVRSTVRA